MNLASFLPGHRSPPTAPPLETTLQQNLEAQTVTMVRYALSIAEYRNKLEDRNLELLKAKEEVEKQNVVLLKNARDLAQYQRQLEARNAQLQEALETTQQLSNSLAKEKQQMEILLQSLTDGVFAVDQNNQVLLFNKAAEKITELRPDQVLGHHVDEVIRFYRGDEPVALNEYTQQLEKIAVELRRDGLAMKLGHNKVYVSLRVSPVEFTEPGKQGWIITFNDITKERQLEAMKLDFVSMAAHELRTPLTTIKGYISMLQMPESLDKLNDQEKDIINKALMSSLRLDKLIENLLIVSRIEKEEMSLNLQTAQITDLAQKSVNELAGLAKDKGLELQFIPPESQIPEIQIDPLRIGEVFSNLIGNAVNYTAQGKISVTIKQIDQQIVVSISDTGRGIPKEALSHLFTKFFRVKSDLVEGKSKGTGLGLYISKNIIKAHGGDIWVESEPGKGSTFSFSLPLSKSA